MHDPSSTLWVDLDALVANYRMLADKAAPAIMGATIKADAYGLGITAIGPTLAYEGCNHLFVATLGEAALLRPLVESASIYVLNGLGGRPLREFVDEGVIPVLNDLGQVEEWARFCMDMEARHPAAIHIDTGMNRLGLTAKEAQALTGEAAWYLDHFDLALLMSHLTHGEIYEAEENREQVRAFTAITRALPKARTSMSNTAGVLMGPQYDLHLVRPGIGLFGGNAFTDRPNAMTPVVAWTARILQVRDAPKGAAVGYGGAWRAARDSRIATAALGYADGYGTGFSNTGAAVVAGQRVPVVGRVSMDLVTLDVTDIPPDKVTPGEEAYFLGQGLTLDEVAAAGGMSQYELLTGIGGRVTRRYIKDGKPQ